MPKIKILNITEVCSSNKPKTNSRTYYYSNTVQINEMQDRKKHYPSIRSYKKQSTGASANNNVNNYLRTNPNKLL